MPDDAPFKDWLTTIDAAKVLECTRGCVLQMVRRGKFPNCTKVSGIIMIPVSDITSFKENRARQRKRNSTKFVVPQRDLGL